ncbi:RNA methyltransferase [Croceicoccus estronivorus]|uniref:RsmB/NOP family class I SAM-dependent RNA methyltransferase n=1 Tax=Croceicoccus estronivorus TaxID=1172626 RepID=UPI00082FB802|nr:RsmB/NOP family class I SAM-dependent RNA methyltransferase [Croceicoccus estronivorus]OCC23228.1 RNA methyltransferase [Croceicoccus estronivorus]
MTPAARVQAAIELLDLVIEAARSRGAPADRIVAEWFRSRRFAGSKDRRAVRELLYRAIRVCGPVPPTGRSAMLRLAADDQSLVTLFDGSRHGPAPLCDDEEVAEGGCAPAWLEDRLRASDIAGEELEALLDRAPLDLRINTLRGADPLLPIAGDVTQARNALRYPAGTQVERWDAFRDGAVEVQDTGSQLACEALGVQPGQTVVDFCAGAGGKTLSLAAAMENKGRLLACDVDRARLSRLAPRVERAGVTNVETRLLDAGRETAGLTDWAGIADAVLVDAPCSGTGTWRRNPEARWRLNEDELARTCTLQQRVLDMAASLVRPGGRLLYVVCSLLDEEGGDQIDCFLSTHRGWQIEPFVLPAGRERSGGVRLTPLHDGTDGFFIARLVSPC